MPRRHDKIKVKIKLTGALATRNGNRVCYTFELPLTTPVSVLLMKLRKTIKLEPAEALFLFLEDKIAGMSHTVSQYKNKNKTEITGTLCGENCFGGWSKLFIKASIKKVIFPHIKPDKCCYEVCVTWSWYGMMNWDETKIFGTIEEAKSFLLNERTNGHLQIVGLDGMPLEQDS